VPCAQHAHSLAHFFSSIATVQRGAPGAALCLSRALPRPPGRLPQEKVFQDELPFAGGERSIADLARYFQIDGLGARLNFDNLVKRLTV
jgi:hypothetical protein